MSAAQIHEPADPKGGAIDGATASFQEMSLTRGDLRIHWEWIGEGADGDWEPDDEQDVPLLRFSVYRRVDDPVRREELGGDAENPWVAIDDASYCTNMPLVAEVHILRAGLELMLDRIETAFQPGDPSPSAGMKSACEELSWIGIAEVERTIGSAG